MPLAAHGQTNHTRSVSRFEPLGPTFKLPSHVVSVSRQFTVFAEDQGLAAGLAGFADKIKTRLLGKLLLRDDWRHPIVISVRAHTNTPARKASMIGSSVYQTGRSLKYQIECVIPPPVNQEQFVREVVQVLCAEIANRDLRLTEAETRIATVPLWFSEGLTQNLLGDVRAVELEIVRRALEQEGSAPLDAIFQVETLPRAGIEQELWKAKCKLLLRALGTLPNGPRRAQQFLVSLRPDKDWRDVFHEVYADVLPDVIAAENWWAEQLQVRAGPSPLNRLSAKETEARLMESITMEAVHVDPETKREVTRKVPLLEMRNYIDKPGTKEMLEGRIVQLENLQLSAHQAYLVPIGKYIEALNHVRLERFRLLPATLKEAESALQDARKLSSEISESLDRFEAEQMNRELLFLYRDYFQTFEEVQSIEQARESAIKEYLDKFQSTDSSTNSPVSR